MDVGKWALLRRCSDASGPEKTRVGGDRRIRNGQFKESRLRACGILSAGLIRGGERGSFLFQYVTAFPIGSRPSQRACDGGIISTMLPGIRFLLAAILLSVSIVVFGLGAAALLRAAHEDFASNPSWRVTPETRFTQNEMPTLALLRVDIPPPVEKPADTPVSVAPEATTIAPAPAAPAEQVAAASPAHETTVAPAAAPTAPAIDTAKTEAAPAPPQQTSEPSPAAVASEAPPAVDQANKSEQNKPEATQGTKTAMTESSDAPPKASEVTPVAPEPATPDVAGSEPPKPDAAKPESAKPESAKPESAVADAARPEQASAPPTRTAKLDTPAARVEAPSPTKAEVRKAAERAAEKEKARAEKKAKARRLAAQRARAARQLATQRADPFGQTTSLQRAPSPARTP